MNPSVPENLGGNLEDRLRGLILSNVSSNAISRVSSATLMPPHMVAADLEEQQEYLRNHQAFASNSPTSPSRGQTPAGRRRPNQAQRRHLSSQNADALQFSDGFRGNHSNKFPNLRGASNINHPPSQYHGFNQRQVPSVTQAPNLNDQPSSRSPLHEPTRNNIWSPSSPTTPIHHFSPRQPFRQGYLYEPSPHSGNGRNQSPRQQDIADQSTYLDNLVRECVPKIFMTKDEEAEKEQFRALLEEACRQTIAQFEVQELVNKQFNPASVELQCFGSMRSGFAIRSSDMDLALLTPESIPAPDSADSVIPRLLEKKLLDLGYGARLLTRTRVPIIKLCQRPTEKLRVDLLNERAKWENRFIVDPNYADKIAEQVASKAPGSPLAKSLSMDAGITSSSKADGRPAACEISELRQAEHQSLVDYYNSAKRFLGKAGGRDVSPGSPSFSEPEAQLLNETCRAFIDGLSLKALAENLRKYKSIMSLFDYEKPVEARSLQGVFTQAEGERLAMAWDSRPVAEASERLEAIGQSLMDEWRSLQNRFAEYADSLSFNRQLYLAVDRIKRLPSLQLMFLEQLYQEEPTKYHARAQKILLDLRNRERHESSNIDSLGSIVIAHYIAGVNDATTREVLQQVAEPNISLGQIFLRHRMLQLAIDYEQALEQQLYGEEHRREIEQYIELLRSKSLCTSNLLGTTSSELEATLATRVCFLPDPRTLNPNKPRDRYHDPLEFPKKDIGIQCDINFSAHLALHNTLLLRCYSHCDPRVKLLMLFVKQWAKLRAINTPYRGTLSSYGYVLMVLHYLVNVAQPFVCPNLQLVRKNLPSHFSPGEIAARSMCNGHDVHFWRNEAEIKDLSNRKLINHNHDSIGYLLRGFFEYYAQGGYMTTINRRGFDWGREVLSLRTPHGILSKQEKGWVGARTVVETSGVAAPHIPTVPKPMSRETQTTIPLKLSATASTDTNDIKTAKSNCKTIEETKEVRHRYLFAIEDPFELDHNVARTVTHNGIVSIRDEFRRSWRIIKNIGKYDQGQNEGLLDTVDVPSETTGSLQELLGLIHGITTENH